MALALKRRVLHKGKAMKKLKMLGVAFALAGAAFVFTMMKDPPQSVAGHPGAVTVKSAGAQVPTDLPAIDCLTTPTVCP